ncbi:MAG: outer membrane lipoprotein-sorting protein, partial [Patescibacteria group bacterium]|nr:outer membrane lipoprotein-sorting protein [Patescibacteria group bacterium]
MKILNSVTSLILFSSFIISIETFFNISMIFASDLTDPKEIIRRVDNNLVPESSKSQTTMIIYERGRKYEKQMTSYGEGQKRSFAEFNSPPRDKGTKFLKIEDNMWMYMPSVEKVIKIAGHMLRQSMMGSDFSYEDILEARKLLEKYNPILQKKEQFDGRDCYVLELTAIAHDVTYYRRFSK